MMFEVFKNYLLERIPITAEELEWIKSLATIKRVSKLHFILEAGEYSSDLIFVASGILKLARTDKDGNENILRFATEYHWISDRESYLNGTPSNCSIQAIENSEIISFKKDDFRYLLNKIPALKKLMKELQEKAYVANQNRIFSSISSTSAEKYLDFIANHPTVFNRVPLHMVASYLGLARETLSRLRKDHLKKKINP